MTGASATSRSGEPVLQADGLGRQVQGRWLWRGFDLTLAAGERLAVTGPSGSGKTLLLRSLAGLDLLDEGSVTFAGTPLLGWSMPRYRAQVAYLPQRPAMVEGTVATNLRLPFGLKAHRARSFPSAAVDALLERLGRGASFLDQSATDLSGGESQLVALMRVLLLEPAVLLLDEPSASLDEDVTAALEDVVRAWLEAEPERAVIWTSHQRSQLERVAERRVALGPNG